MTVPYSFASRTTAIPLSELDSNFNTTITLGNTAIQLGNTVTTLNNMTLANVTITSGTINSAVTHGDVVATGGLYAKGNLAATFSDGVVLDYVTGTARISSGSSDNVAFYNGGVANTELMRIDSSGNVGIGTSSPAYKLDTYGVVRGQVQSGSTNNTAPIALIASNKTTGTAAAGLGAALQFEIADSGGGYAAGKIGTVATADPFVSNLAFYTYNYGYAERMRIDSSGVVKINTTSSSYAGFLVALNTSASYPAASFVQSTAAGGDNVYFYAGTTKVGSITTTSSATAYNTSSDYRLKENIQPMQGALDVVAQLNPVTYTWKADGSDGQGFIAHELQAVVPDCVTGEKDAVDAEGKPVYQGIDTSFLVATLTKAIQELKAEVDDLKAQLKGN